MSLEYLRLIPNTARHPLFSRIAVIRLPVFDLADYVELSRRQNSVNCVLAGRVEVELKRLNTEQIALLDGIAISDSELVGRNAQFGLGREIVECDFECCPREENRKVVRYSEGFDLYRRGIGFGYRRNLVLRLPVPVLLVAKRLMGLCLRPVLQMPSHSVSDW